MSQTCHFFKLTAYLNNNNEHLFGDFGLQQNVIDRLNTTLPGSLGKPIVAYYEGGKEKTPFEKFD